MKNKRKIILIFAAIIILVAIIFAVNYGNRICRDISGVNFPNEPRIIHIPEGSGSAQVANILYDEDIISFPQIFRIYVRSNNGNLPFQRGYHILSRGMSYSELVRILTATPRFSLPPGTVRVTIPEGFEIRQIADRLYREINVGRLNYAEFTGGEILTFDRDRFMYEIDNGDFDFDFVRAISWNGRINRLEGYLFPATYDILPTDTEFDIINNMLTAFYNRVMPIYREINPSQSLDEIIIMASIVEREAVHDAERPTIAGVFYNRIQRGMLLQSCATVKYTFDLGTRPAILSNAQTRMNSPYNTYVNLGLPIGPIASPGVPSIRAAMEWEEHSYIFFTANINSDGHVFTRTYAEHQAASRARERANR